VELESKHILRSGCAVLVGVGEQFVPDIEWILLALPKLLTAEAAFGSPDSGSAVICPVAK